MSPGTVKMGAGIHGVASAVSVKTEITNTPIKLGNTKIECTLGAEAHFLGGGYSADGTVELDTNGTGLKGKAGAHLGAIVPPWGGLVLSMQCVVEPEPTNQPVTLIFPPALPRQ